MNKKESLTKQDHIKLLQQAVLNTEGGMEMLIGMREKLQKKINRIEDRVGNSNHNWDKIDRLELELLKVVERLFDGKER